jgi:hypothetical protein
MNKMVIGIIIAVVAAGVGIGSYYWLGADNPIEEECEKVIKDETGMSVDLSPNSTPTSTTTSQNQ